MNKSAYGRVHSAKNFIVMVGCDGVARLFDIRGALGTGSLCGAVLRSRIPKATSGGVAVQQSAVHARGAHSNTAALTFSSSFPHSASSDAGYAYTHPSAATAATAAPALRSPPVSHFMTHPADRRSSQAQAQPPTQTHVQVPQMLAHSMSLYSESNDASFGYDFIVHDSTDDQDAHGKRRAAAGFRCASAARSVSGASGTFGTFSGKGSTGKHNP